MSMDISEFKCLGCGACCRQEGYVRLEKNEPDIIAAFLHMDVLNFIETYTRVTRDRRCLALIDKANGECIFLNSKGCRINGVKPRQCREFPVSWRFRDFENICAWAINNPKKS